MTNINDKKQVLIKRSIGLLNTNIEHLRKILLKENIGRYTGIGGSEGIGYVSNFYSNAEKKHRDVNEHDLLSLVNDKININNQYSEENDYLTQFNHGNYIKNTIDGLFSYTHDEDENRIKLVGLNNEKFETTYSVLTEFLQYDNIKYAMEKTRIGTINPNPLLSLNGGVVTNIRDFSGTDTKLGLLTNQIYAHTLKNGAKFNSLRKTPYITPEVYTQIGNKLSTLSLLSSNFRIDDRTGRLIYDIGNNFNETFNYDDVIDLDSFEEKNRVIYKNNIYHTPLYDNFIKNKSLPFTQYKKPKINNVFTNYFHKGDFSLHYTWDELGQKKINSDGYLIDKTLETFTQNKEGEIKNGTLITRFHTTKGADETHNKITQFQTAVSKFGLSHGRNLLNKNAYYYNNEGDNKNPYCRVWTKEHQYESLENTIRPFSDNSGNIITFSDLQKKLKRYENFSNNTVFDENGLVRIVPTSTSELKKCMFSIENLAWRDVRLEDYLSSGQIGPNEGRIMWFPPYNLNFNENVQANWNLISFIGRGEKVPTYIDTDRSGTLSFTLLVDHPSILDKWNKNNFNNNDDKEQELLRFFAGNDIIEGEKIDTKPISLNSNPVIIPNEITEINVDVKHDSFYIFLPKNINYLENVDNLFDELCYNDEVSYFNLGRFALKNEYQKIIDEPSDLNKYNCLTYYKKPENFPNIYYCFKYIMIINDAGESDMGDKEYYIWVPENYKSQTTSLFKFFDRTKNKETIREIKINCCGNKKIDTKIKNMFSEKFSDIKIEQIEYVEKGYDFYNDMYNSIKVEVLYKNDGIFTNISKENNEVTEKITNEKSKVVTSSIIETDNTSLEKNEDNKKLNEYQYFKNIKQEDNFLYKKIIDKVNNFYPAFHSITPEGFNERLSFLHQCTRQGQTFETSSQSGDYRSAGNLSFGRPPVCILRLGDFYHTKIIIQSISITYDNNLWDMNPEGIGMQPMYANISLNFTFLGGSDLSGPISRLQNAVSFNYYANQSVYDHKSDTQNKTFKVETNNSLTFNDKN